MRPHKNIPINKGNYSLDTPEREELFTRNRAYGVENDYCRNRKEWEEFPNKFHVADYPLLVDLELSTLCNLKCPFCYTITEDFSKKVDARLMDFELFKKVIDEIGNRVFAIRLSLRGEPTIHPNFIETIRYAKENGIKEVSTLTNGSKLTLDFFEKSMKAGLDWITLSFDGLYEEYEKNRYPLKFDVMYNRLREIKKIKQKANKVKPVIKIQTVWPAIEQDPTQYYKMMSEVCDLVAFNPIIDFKHSTPYEEIEFEEDFSCPQLYQRLVVGADGVVLMCSNDEESELPVGNAYQETIYEIWHGDEMTKRRNIHKEKDGFKKLSTCRKCYIPRKTQEDIFEVNQRPLIVRNYI
jgi:radical SAM protein with 4Fe4S-binding SPASM domain